MTRVGWRKRRVFVRALTLYRSRRWQHCIDQAARAASVLDLQGAAEWLGRAERFARFTELANVAANIAACSGLEIECPRRTTCPNTT